MINPELGHPNTRGGERGVRADIYRWEGRDGPHRLEQVHPVLSRSDRSDRDTVATAECPACICISHGSGLEYWSSVGCGDSN